MRVFSKLEYYVELGSQILPVAELLDIFDNIENGEAVILPEATLEVLIAHGVIQIADPDRRWKIAMGSNFRAFIEALCVETNELVDRDQKKE